MKKIILFAFLFQLLSCIEAKIDNASTEILEDGISSNEHRVFLSFSTSKENIGGGDRAPLTRVCKNVVPISPIL